MKLFCKIEHKSTFRLLGSIGVTYWDALRESLTQHPQLLIIKNYMKSSVSSFSKELFNLKFLSKRLFNRSY